MRLVPRPDRGLRALVIAAHGSRKDPAANALVRRVAEEVRGRRLFDQVAAAFHQGEPGFDTVLDELEADEVTVVPFMTSTGHYSEVVLPAALARSPRYAELRLRITPPVGSHPGVAPLVARRVSGLLREHVLDRNATSLLLVGHGTPRHPESRRSTLELAATLQRRRVAREVVAGFLDDDPPVAHALEQITSELTIVLPFLIGGGTHAVDDLPALLAPTGRSILLDQPVGLLPGLTEIVIDLARRHTPPPPKLRRGGRTMKSQMAATVHLVGAGPGDPELITVRGLDLLRAADVVVHDRLANPELLGEAPPSAELVDAGKGPGHAALSQKEINALLVERAREGKRVVRLKGGDPFVFGRGSEELTACRNAEIYCEVVPGISSAIAGPAAAGIPVTARGIARSFAVVTAQQTGGAGEVDLGPLSSVDTLVVLMGRAHLASLTRRLIDAGRDPKTPAACIQAATTPLQRVIVATLETIAATAELEGLEAPMVTVVGEVASLATDGAWLTAQRSLGKALAATAMA